MPKNLEKRLARVERTFREVPKNEKAADCNCKQFFAAVDPDVFEAEANLRCPAHGFRDLGTTIFHTIIGLDRERNPEKHARIDRLISEYITARARHTAKLELEEDDSQEL
jgi:hypothetical protein